MTRVQLVNKYFMQNPDDSLDQASKELKIPKSTIQNIVAKEVIESRCIYIVPSLSCENEFHIFNGINERVLYTNYKNEVKNSEAFNKNELAVIRRKGFTIPNFW
jgi:hypothetical protein